MAKKITIQTRFDLFIKKAKEIEQSSLYKSGMQWSFNVSGEITENEEWEMKSTINGPIENELKAFLLDFRHFISPKEPIFINRIFNDAIRSCTDEKTKENLTLGKNEWNNMFNKNMGMGVTVNGEEINTSKIFDLWINGEYFHSDQEKANILKSMNSLVPLGKAQFLMVIPHLAQHIVILASLIENGLLSNKFHLK